MKIERNWSFKSQEVADNFDAHVREQLPWYDLASESIVHFIRHYLPEKGIIYDIGASTGNLYNRLMELIGDRKATYHALDNSQEMINKWNEWIDLPFFPNVKLHYANADSFEYKPFDCGILFLVLMFIPYANRKQLIKTLWDNCKPGGVILVVDKEEQPNGYYGTALHRLTLQGKINQGVQAQEIIDKELSLQGVQRPLRFNQLFDEYNPRQFFRFGEFQGIMLEKLI
jgi:tRNA (cmo5U34)-methyltransferase